MTPPSEEREPPAPDPTSRRRPGQSAAMTPEPKAQPGAAQRLHPATLVFGAADTARQLVVPALLGGVSVGGGEVGGVVSWVIGLLAVPALLVAAARYFSFRYRLDPEALVVESGVLQRRRRAIPLMRIQNVDSRQGALQRLAGVSELRIETAGGRRAEAVLSVLAVSRAEELRREILERRRHLLQRAAPGGAEAPEPPAQPLHALGWRDLLLTGATANEAGLIAAGLAGLLQVLDDLSGALPLPRPEAVAERLGRAGDPAPADVAVALLALLAVILLLGWLVSVAGAVIRYHGYRLERRGGELHARWGLLARRAVTIPLDRVQAVRVDESWLRRAFGLAALRIETAGGGPEVSHERGAEGVVPLLRTAGLESLLAEILPSAPSARAALNPVHPRARRRALLRYALTTGVPVVAAALLWESRLLLLLPLCLLFAVPAARAYYRTLGWELLPAYFLARGGLLNRRTWVVPAGRIHVLHGTASPTQRLRGLSTLLVETASGGRPARVVDLAAADAARLLDRLSAQGVALLRAGAERSRTAPLRPSPASGAPAPRPPDASGS